MEPGIRWEIERGSSMQCTDIGIDLGTASILVYIRGKGVVLKEPSVVAFDRDTNKIKAIGEDARLMLGRTPGNIVAVRPLRQGVNQQACWMGSARCRDRPVFRWAERSATHAQSS